MFFSATHLAAFLQEVSPSECLDSLVKACLINGCSILGLLPTGNKGGVPVPVGMSLRTTFPSLDFGRQLTGPAVIKSSKSNDGVMSKTV